MILSMGLGEPNYLPDSVFGEVRDSAEIDSVAFLQCYGREIVHWEIICFFSVFPDEWCSLRLIAADLDCPPDSLGGPVAELAETGLLEERILVTGPLYRLTPSVELRRAAIRVGWPWRRELCYLD